MFMKAGALPLFSGKHLLDDAGNPVIEPDLMKWARWFESSFRKRQVGDTSLPGVRVSTVFLGIDHNFMGHGPPILYETMVFCDDAESPWNQFQRRWTTKEAAKLGHDAIVLAIKNGEFPEI